MNKIIFVLLLLLSGCVFIKQDAPTAIGLRHRFEKKFNATLRYEDSINRNSVAVYGKNRKRLGIGQIRRLSASIFSPTTLLEQYAESRFVNASNAKVRLILQDIWLENYKTNSRMEEAFLSIGQEHTVRIINANVTAEVIVEKNGEVLKKQFREVSWWNLNPRNRSKTTVNFTKCADNALNKLVLSVDDWLSSLNL
jgi:hypothetical protein